MELEPINNLSRSPCRDNMSDCGKEAIVAGMAIELDNKFIAIGTIITIVAGWFLSLSSTIIGVSFILIGAMIFMTKRAIEMIKRFTAEQKNRNIADIKDRSL